MDLLKPLLLAYVIIQKSRVLAHILFREKRNNKHSMQHTHNDAKSYFLIVSKNISNAQNDRSLVILVNITCCQGNKIRRGSS